MKLRFLMPLLILGLGVQLRAQDKANALIVSDEETFTLNSQTSGEYHVVKTIMVFSDAGDSEAMFYEFTDPYRSLSSFKGTMERDGAKPVKIGKGDLTTVSLTSGLADDGFITAYRPQAAAYPYTITYDYTITYKKAIAVFPSFFPVTGEKTAVTTASYTLKVPAGTEIQQYASGVSGPEKETVKNNDVYRWNVVGFKGYVAESFMPPVNTLIPFVMTAPVEFTYAGTKGSQKNWQEVGRWCYDLQKGTDDLPEDFVAKLKEMTDGCGSNLEKIRTLYNYLRENTRYVSIQLGIGGYRPFPASQVKKSGFGDCKGLSNYMRSMLASIGIDSYYTILNTDRAKVLPGISSFGQFNHVMVCVPLPEKNDTLWLECTAPSLPLGYKHEDIAGHNVLYLTPDGGRLTTVSTYPDSLSRREMDATVILKADGYADVSVKRTFCLDQMENWLHIKEWKQDKLIKELAKGLSVQPQNLTLTGVKDNFEAYDGPSYCPVMEVDYTFNCRQFANGNGNRLFVPGNPFPKSLSPQRGTRINDIVSGGSTTTSDRIRIILPEGYRPEALPDPVKLATEWGSYTSTFSEEDGAVVVLQEFKLNSFHKPASEYPSFRSFMKAINKAAGVTLVLVKE